MRKERKPSTAKEIKKKTECRSYCDLGEVESPGHRKQNASWANKRECRVFLAAASRSDLARIANSSDSRSLRVCGKNSQQTWKIERALGNAIPYRLRWSKPFWRAAQKNGRPILVTVNSRRSVRLQSSCANAIGTWRRAPSSTIAGSGIAPGGNGVGSRRRRYKASARAIAVQTTDSRESRRHYPTTLRK